MAEVWLDHPEAAVLDALEADPARSGSARAVLDVLRRIAADPGADDVRRLRFHAVGYWGVPVSGNSEDWLILWEPHETESDVILLGYLGPASFL